MSDDFLDGTDDVSNDTDFDPNAVDSDMFLDDPKDMLDADLSDGDLMLDDDDDLLDE